MKKVVIGIIVALCALTITLAVGGPKLYDIYKTERIGLCYKDAQTNWQCAPGPDGSIRYSVVDDKLIVYVYANHINPDAVYQLTLNGDGTNNHGVDDTLAGLGDNAFESGKWGNEGFYNFETNLPVTRTYRTCSNVGGCHTTGRIQAKFEVDLPEGIYEGVKFIVKEVGGVDAQNPYGTSWTPKLMEEAPMNFVIVKP